MNDPLLVRFLQRLGNLGGDFESFVQGNWATRDPVRQSLSGNQLENEVVRFIRLLQPIDRGDVRMVEGREDLGLSLESPQALFVLGELVR